MSGVGVLSIGTLISQGLFAADERSGDMIYRKLGRTGERVSAIGLGGYHIGMAPDEQASIRLIRSAIDRGMTFMDNSWDYMDGKCETWMGKALADGYRQKFFLMTKFDGRTKASTTKQIDESLQRLQTDHVDLMQFHENIRMEDPDRFFNEGPLEALLEAKKAGKIRYIGFTGHKDPVVHLRMIELAQATREGSLGARSTMLRIATSGLATGFAITASVTFSGYRSRPLESTGPHAIRKKRS